MSKECPYCHIHHVKNPNKSYGKAINDYTEWWDFRRTKIRKRVVTSIVNPEEKHPKLRANVLFRFNPETLYDLKIHYCPMCGRKLGGGRNSNAKSRNDTEPLEDGPKLI